MADRVKKSLLLPLFLAVSFCSLPAMDHSSLGSEAAALREVEQSLAELDRGLSEEEISRYAREMEQGMVREERDEIRNRNKILWSIPAAFPADKFDENVQDLHANIPFYGKVSLGNRAYRTYMRWLKGVKEAYNMGPVESFATDVYGMHDGFQQGLDSGDSAFGQKAGENPALHSHLRGVGIDLSGKSIRGIYAPGARWYEYLTGKNLIGVGLYKSDLQAIGFIAANIGSEYLLFRDIKRVKSEKVKEVVLANSAKCIDLLERLAASVNDSQSHQKIKQELSGLVVKECSLFRYNPLKKEVLLPVVKYLALQRVVEMFKNNQPPSLHAQSDQMFAFVPDGERGLVRSGVTPISAVKVAGAFVAPVAAFSETSKATLYKAVKNLRFIDRLCSNFSLPSFCYSETDKKVGMPSKFYWLMASIVGETLVVLMAIKVIDSFLNTQFINALAVKPEGLLGALKEHARLLDLANPSQEEREQIIACDQRIEKEIEQAFSLSKTGFRNWVHAKRVTFAKIGVAGFCCFVLPSVVMKVAPLIKNVIQSYWR